MPIRLCIPLVGLWIAWVAFVFSLLLPAYDGMERAGSPPGVGLVLWQAITDSCVALAVKWWILLFEPRFALVLLAPLGSLFVLCAPFLTHALRDGCWPVALPPCLLSVSMWFLPIEIYEHTLYGFWIWNLSALAIGAAVFFSALAFSLYDRESVSTLLNAPRHTQDWPA